MQLNWLKFRLKQGAKAGVFHFAQGSSVHSFSEDADCELFLAAINACLNARSAEAARFLGAALQFIDVNGDYWTLERAPDRSLKVYLNHNALVQSLKTEERWQTAYRGFETKVEAEVVLPPIEYYSVQRQDGSFNIGKLTSPNQSRMGPLSQKRTQELALALWAELGLSTDPGDAWIWSLVEALDQYLPCYRFKSPYQQQRAFDALIPTPTTDPKTEDFRRDIEIIHQLKDCLKRLLRPPHGRNILKAQLDERAAEQSRLYAKLGLESPPKAHALDEALSLLAHSQALERLIEATSSLKGLSEKELAPFMKLYAESMVESTNADLKTMEALLEKISQKSSEASAKLGETHQGKNLGALRRSLQSLIFQPKDGEGGEPAQPIQQSIEATIKNSIQETTSIVSHLAENAEKLRFKTVHIKGDIDRFCGQLNQEALGAKNAWQSFCKKYGINPNWRMSDFMAWVKSLPAAERLEADQELYKAWEIEQRSLLEVLKKGVSEWRLRHASIKEAPITTVHELIKEAQSISLYEELRLKEWEESLILKSKDLTLRDIEQRLKTLWEPSQHVLFKLYSQVGLSLPPPDAEEYWDRVVEKAQAWQWWQKLFLCEEGAKLLAESDRLWCKGPLRVISLRALSASLSLDSAYKAELQQIFAPWEGFGMSVVQSLPSEWSKAFGWTPVTLVWTAENTVKPVQELAPEPIDSLLATRAKAQMDLLNPTWKRNESKLGS